MADRVCASLPCPQVKGVRLPYADSTLADCCPSYDFCFLCTPTLMRGARLAITPTASASEPPAASSRSCRTHPPVRIQRAAHVHDQRRDRRPERTAEFVLERQALEFGAERMSAVGDARTARCPLVDDEAFLRLATYPPLLALAGGFGDYIVLMQQNGIVNSPAGAHTPASYRRDLPYQHFVSSRPLAVSALFCIDPFRPETGATTLIPRSIGSRHSHPRRWRPPPDVSVGAEPGSFIVFDSMLFHRAGVNTSGAPRRAAQPRLHDSNQSPAVSLPGRAEQPSCRRFGPPAAARLRDRAGALGRRLARTAPAPRQVAHDLGGATSFRKRRASGPDVEQQIDQSHLVLERRMQLRIFRVSVS